jgi:hypothetical protein
MFGKAAQHRNYWGKKEPTVEERHSGRSGSRSLCAAQGVLVALRRCSLDEAFIDIVETAKRHHVAPLGLADALVAIAENDLPRYFDVDVIAAAHRAWGGLLSRAGDNTAPAFQLAGAAAGTGDDERQR